ncbi:MAG: hypothetical protein IVW55_16490 [Chloroflexi bacterium]|nr:hypothetical protein [Chloroflexota bacterium]
MQDSNVQDVAATTAPVPTTGGDGSYAMSREGRRRAIILLLGVASIWVFALWSLITILQDGVSGVEWVSSLLMIGIIVVAPLVAWSLLEEANARITTSERGIGYSTIGGIKLNYSWSELSSSRPDESRGRIARFFLGEDDSKTDEQENATVPVAPEEGTEAEATDDDEIDTLLLRIHPGSACQIANPLVRFLHRQAQGDALPVYAGLENRDALLREIASHTEIS